MDSKSNLPILYTNNKGDIPEGAVLIPKEEIFARRLEQIVEWRPKFDVWALRYGGPILSGLASLSAISITAHYRKKLILRSQGYYSMYTALVFAPAFMSGAFHHQLILHEILTSRFESSCPVCLQSKAGLLQGGLSTVYPMLLASTSGFMFAARHGTYDLPHYKDFKGLWNLWWKFTKPIMSRVSILFIAEAVAANIITYLEAKHFYSLQEKLLVNLSEQYVKNET